MAIVMFFMKNVDHKLKILILNHASLTFSIYKKKKSSVFGLFPSNLSKPYKQTRAVTEAITYSISEQIR